MKKAIRMSAALLLVALVGCPEWSPWSEPVPVTELNTAVADRSSCLSLDGLTVYFDSNRTGSLGNADLWVAHRPDQHSPWGVPVNLGAVVNTEADEAGPTLSTDGRVLVFLSNRAGGFGETDLYVCRRMDPEDDFGWGSPENMGPYVNTAEIEQAPHLQRRGEGGNRTLYFGRGATQDIFAARVSEDGEPLESAEPLDELNSSGVDVGVSISLDGRELYFHSNRPGGFGNLDIYVSTRTSVLHAWGVPQNLGALINTATAEFSPDISADGRTLLFTATLRPGGQGAADIWISTRTLAAGDTDDDEENEGDDEDDD